MPKVLELLAWSLTWISLSFYLKIRYRFKTHWIKPKPQTNFILICNHGNFFDPFLIGRETGHIAYLTNANGMRKGLPRFLVYGLVASQQKKDKWM